MTTPKLSPRGSALLVIPSVLAGAAALLAGCAQLTGPLDASSAPMVAASDMPALLRRNGCHACHAQSETLLGPSYEAIAAMHGPRKDVMVDVLAEKIVAGGAGNWGVVPMVANERVSSGDARAMAAWILDQAPG